MTALKRSMMVVLLGLMATSKAYPFTISTHPEDSNPDYKPQDYSYSYGVKDLDTGDVKHQWEKKDGDVVTGHYSILEPDGSVRVVYYTADEKHGFNAVVKHQGMSYHPLEDKKPSSHSEILVKPSAHPSVDYTTVKQSYKTELEFLPHDSSNKIRSGATDEQVRQTFASFLPEESRHEAIKSTISLPLPTYITRPKDFKPRKPAQYYHPSSLQGLPIDLHALTQNNDDKIIPVDVSVLNPVEIDLSESATEQHHNFSPKDTSMKPSHQISQEQIHKFFDDYYKSGLEKLNEPEIETGFKPIIRKTNNFVTHPAIPQTFKSNKKPITTPGLMNFGSKFPNSEIKGRPYLQNLQNHNLSIFGRKTGKGGQLKLRRGGKSNGFITYKTVTYED